MKLFGFHSVKEHQVVISEEELRLILSESYEKGEINQSEFRYVNKIFEFDNRVARDYDSADRNCGYLSGAVA